MSTAYITHADCLRHEMGNGHPENPDRLHAINEHLRVTGLLEAMRCLEAPLATVDDLKRVHEAGYVDSILEKSPQTGYVQLDPDTAMNSHSLNAAMRAAGAGLLAVDEIMAGRTDNAFCAVRPCGHHATQTRSMGFCIFNNVGVAAAYALQTQDLDRVAIIDFDVHHGNGTEDLFGQPQWAQQVLMVSFFQHPFYPHSGTVYSATNMVNIPLPEGSGGAVVMKTVASEWLPALDAFRPQMVFISAGFDAHKDDTLGGMALIEADYAWMTRELMVVAARHSDNRIVSMLEGGYNLDALGRSAVAHVRQLLTVSS